MENFEKSIQKVVRTLIDLTAEPGYVSPSVSSLYAKLPLKSLYSANKKKGKKAVESAISAKALFLLSCQFYLLPCYSTVVTRSR